MTLLFDDKVFPNILQESYFEFNGEDFLFFDEPVDFYTLRRNGRRINSFPELMYVGEVLLHLNPDLPWEKFVEMMLWVSNRENKRSIRTYSVPRVEAGCHSIFQQRKKPYVPRKRRVIFHPTRPIPKEEKMSIVGRVCGGGKCSEESIYLAIEELMESDIRITVTSIAEQLGVSRQTIHRHLTESLNEIIHDFNLKLGKK